MNSFASTWSFAQFLSQAGVNVIILAFSMSFKLGSVHTAMVSQGVVMAFCFVFLTMCWTMMPKRPSRHILPKGHSLLFAGFKQNFRTFKKIITHYKTGLRWFLISTIFGEAAASAVGTTAVVFLQLNLGLTAQQIGIFFEVSLLGVVAGTKVRVNGSIIMISFFLKPVWYSCFTSWTLCGFAFDFLTRHDRHYLFSVLHFQNSDWVMGYKTYKSKI